MSNGKAWEKILKLSPVLSGTHEGVSGRSHLGDMRTGAILFGLR